MNQNNNPKSVLVIGAGRWGKIMVKVFLSLGFSVKYATRNLRKDLNFEKELESSNISLFNPINKTQFDIISICVRPNDIYEAWEKYHTFGNSILIEKPGPISISKLKTIIKTSNLNKKPTLINYEHYYTKTSRDLRKALRDNLSNIKSIEMKWEKPFVAEGGIEWRLLPHLIAELFITPSVEIQYLNTNINQISASLEGMVKDIPFLIQVSDSKNLIHHIKINMKNGDCYYKDRDKFSINGSIISENTFSSLTNMINLLIDSEDNIYSENAELALFVAKNLISID